MNRPDAHDLLATAREVLLKQLLPMLPPSAHYEARMIASAMLIASREMAQAAACAEIEGQALAAVLALHGQAESDSDQARARVARQIRQGAYDPAGAARTCLLEALRTINRAQLNISNPKVVVHD